MYHYMTHRYICVHSYWAKHVTWLRIGKRLFNRYPAPSRGTLREKTTFSFISTAQNYVHHGISEYARRMTIFRNVNVLN